MRLFIALDLPAAHKHQLYDLREPSWKARWVTPEQFHLTLRFLGSVEASLLPELTHSLATIKAPAFELAPRGLIALPSPARPRVLAAAVELHPALQALQAEIERRVVALGFAPEARPFRPHITLARLKQVPATAVRAFLQQHRDFSLPPFSVQAFHLYQSHLHPDGARYEMLYHFPLQG
ncbi:2'-5' RNA ligase [Rhodothermus profundi]|uniref:RNA 2',3'-cyclic phosphodiesterase n=1 Tax=Rhodothermus profundi TaxID=633813 RepID=A0A1M6PWV2_9BACT|nr:2'-5' RNA ligase [Rhodothermus profundi]